MSNENDLMKLYSQRILALAAEIPHTGRLDTPQATAKKRSPLCGSTVTVDVDVTDGRVSRYAADVKACALGQASASVVGAAAIGRTREEIEKARDELKAMLRDGGDAPAAPFDGLEALLPAREYKNRHASIMLTLDALSEAVAQAEAAQTV
ncbi:iron-sulfur cluster assembly scaffold protein [Donghicola sp. C2-DW-16]|uniref:Iron-sulfur cluster assembly scaffold protein n=1 Tax=Donghicola mangrovi TaxID=2729614 RepID=A0ABX2PED7_9RHOB|nr:iron-sulfur cluster assembly scaffold protein [Donghicola mangrovi]NVO27819.1 iron-sulfur cluster assembly scaffold protein [Donghicola mangrovi]